MVFVIHWHESAMDLYVFPIPIPPPTSLSTRSLWVFPVHQAWTLVSCNQPGLVICFTLDDIHVLMLFSQNIPPNGNDNLTCETEKETDVENRLLDSVGDDMYFRISQSKIWVLFQRLSDSVIFYKLDTQELTAHIYKGQTIMPILLYYFECIIGKIPSVVLGAFNLCEKFSPFCLFP